MSYSDKPSVSPTPVDGFDVEVDTLIIGAGACGLVAALAASEAGQSVLVIERDTIPAGSTALSAGLIPAAGSAIQRQAGIEDSAMRFAADIQAKADGENDIELLEALTHGAAEVIDWLNQRHQLPFSLVSDFDYPGHSVRRMHGLPSRSGRELVDELRNVCESHGIDIVCKRQAVELHREAETITGVSVNTDDGERERIGCRKLILACNGFGGNRQMVSRYLPKIDEALWFGHDGNRGEAVLWGQALGASVLHMGAFQGHGNVAHPHGILISWAVITQGGIQVNQSGRRFWNESRGYSEAARVVLSQPTGIAYTIFDRRIAEVARQFEDFKQAESVGAIEVADTLDELAERFGLPVETLVKTVQSIPSDARDEYGRVFAGPGLHPPYCGVRVTGALFHTQGGLDVDGSGRVRRTDGSLFDNLFAGGGAACGVSGSGDSGYLSGNGLLSAVVLGYQAGRADHGPVTE